MSAPTTLFLLIAAFTGLSALAVLVSQNIVRCAVWLLFALAGTAGIFFLLGADFVAATQLIVYVGGVLVLVIFGVMLTAQGPFITMKVGAAEWAIATVVGLLLFTVLVYSIIVTSWPGPAPQTRMANPATSTSSARLGMSFLGVKEVTPKENLTGITGAMEIHQRQRVSYLLPFEIVSVHLLVVLIGAAYLARAKRRGATAI
jgi:NADH-quinone oxidoreductase subunit J